MEDTKLAILADTAPLNPAVLHKDEITWRDLQPWLKQSGYALRPRYHPEWTPSWLNSDKELHLVEDSYIFCFKNRMDATRISDGKFVMMKRVRVDSEENTLAQYFSSAALRADERNKCVPIFDVLQIPDSSDVLLVMPLLRFWDDPRMQTVGEMVEFIRQILEGLAYMHEHHIAHRDVHHCNIMMDAEPLFTEPWHPVNIYDRRDLHGSSRHLTRTIRPVRYYFTDFGLSRQYSPNGDPPQESEFRSGDKTIPEYLLREPYNPFQVDVYCAGNVILEQTTKYRNLKFMRSLFQDMTAVEPAQRPTAAEAFARFETMRTGLSTWRLRSRLVHRWSYPPFTFFKDIPHLVRTAKYIYHGYPALPVPP